jgi:hypothetical protein
LSSHTGDNRCCWILIVAVVCYVHNQHRSGRNTTTINQCSQNLILALLQTIRAGSSGLYGCEITQWSMYLSRVFT